MSALLSFRHWPPATDLQSLTTSHHALAFECHAGIAIFVSDGLRDVFGELSMYTKLVLFVVAEHLMLSIKVSFPDVGIADGMCNARVWACRYS